MNSEISALGPGKAELLENIIESGSISGAAKVMGMSYRRAWTLVAEMNSAFSSPLVDAAVGGKGGGGAEITPLGRDMLQAYRNLEQAIQQVADARFGQFKRHLKK